MIGEWKSDSHRQQNHGENNLSGAKVKEHAYVITLTFNGVMAVDSVGYESILGSHVDTFARGDEIYLVGRICPTYALIF